MRSVVVLPHPDGPSSVANAPFGTSNETSSTAVTPPNRFVTCETRRWTASGTRVTESGTRRSKCDPPAREHGEDDERDDGHPDVGDGERGRASPVEVVHELIDAYRGHGRRRREQEDHHRERRHGPHEGRHEPDAERTTEHRQEDVSEAAELRRTEAGPGFVQPPGDPAEPGAPGLVPNRGVPRHHPVG